MNPVRTGTKTGRNSSKMWQSTFNIGAEQLHSDTEIATALTLQHTLHLRIEMEACSHPIVISSGSELDDETNQDGSLLWKFSPLGYSGPFWGKFSKIRLRVHYRRSKDCDGSRFFRGAFIGGNNFVFNPEANSLLFREFLPWLKQHQCMMPRKLRKPNNLLTFNLLLIMTKIVSINNNNKFYLHYYNKVLQYCKSYLNLIIDSFLN